MTLSHIKLEQVNLNYSSLAFRDRSIKRFFRSALGKDKLVGFEDIHALKDIDLNVEAGERVGIIGPNGSGKSTLLKTVAGLYPIQSGNMSVKGDIRQILDLMLGFEPEATGRDNILYRGLLYGQTPQAIAENTDEIIEFADIGAFIDYPVKTYSAGMAVRLAFSISTALPGDIMLIDEVIGAGDQEFMLKAKTRFQTMVDNSNILLISSHDHHSLSEFCTRCIVLYKGKIEYDGDFSEAQKYYTQMNLNNSTKAV